MSDDKPINLTDQFAMAALQILVRNNDEAGDKNKFTLCNDYITGYDWEGNRCTKISEVSKNAMDKLAEVAYQMAKSMRKARLAAFK